MIGTQLAAVDDQCVAPGIYITSSTKPRHCNKITQYNTSWDVFDITAVRGINIATATRYRASKALADISRSRYVVNETRAPIANLPNSAQIEGTPTIPPSYIRVRAVVWECGEGQRHRHTDTQTVVTNIHCVPKKATFLFFE